MTMPKNGLLLVNLGSPDAPDEASVRRYLQEFLSDPRVMDIPAWSRFLILRLFILPKRPKKVAPLYRAIWTDQGSPLVAYGKQLAQGVQEALGPTWKVALGMRYGEPSLESALEQLQGIGHLAVLPLFPQYASATTGSVIERLMELLGGQKVFPQLAIQPSFYQDPAFLDAFALRGRGLWSAGFDHLLFSFHGLPERHLTQADRTGHCLNGPECCKAPGAAERGCYKAQCLATAQGLAARLEVPPDRWSVAFQSRMGKEVWLGPHFDQELERLVQAGVKRLMVYSPSFVADCLETLEEIGVAGAKRFRALGGEGLALVPSLNQGSDWVQAVAKFAERTF
ncbi:MAG: ferrochelatase [Candidatus Lambdaproteobacteria bacterium RIFOXYD1_FULL_56_27]|uniref:Ferrochelatase n=1 Tax=Candidatus Lambdaproteobacteria bacterium RIFOXYD2_FULL_56_26 TaxID=1817773 RepID=A0A1F6GUT6_9PROT|nr:MAG: ferrochelatase [Candidatus Lambdaproteobacteria bacterium RIFOXYD2_FULL_56_26]OGH10072.1 MAG: ferrochelatase [Candidatus Lambdaproteobacteria bacterium RIFOXYD1_FULL_56_27]